MGMPPFDRPPPPERGIFCSRTLNLRAIKAVGYDMDYTLIHYHVDDWERRAYRHIRAKLEAAGWPVEGLEYQPGLTLRGLVVDRELGNLVKANRFGYVIRACHGARFLPFDELRRAYARTMVDLSEPRWEFLNTFFSLSEACMYAQLVDRLDGGELPTALGYEELFVQIHCYLDEAHMEGVLKGEILADPGRYASSDPEAPLALLDQKQAGKKLLLITNSEWSYTRVLMAHAFDPYLPAGMTWRDLFDVVIVGARKPAFFSGRAPLFEVVDEEDGLLRPAASFRPGKIHLGGSARGVEEHLGLSGEEILFVGDHIYTDVHVTKTLLRWRTALVVRELEDEIRELEDFSADQERLTDLMGRKEALESEHSLARLALQRAERGYAPAPSTPTDELQARVGRLRELLQELDQAIAPLARAAGELHNKNWGLLMRAGSDKSNLARQIERHADIYTSRVSNFLFATPFAYIRAPRGSLPHDAATIPDVAPAADAPGDY